MAMFNAMNISASGMTAQRLRMDILAQNAANATTTRTSDGTPYRRRNVLFEEKSASPFSEILNTATGNISAYIGSGVKVSKIVEDTKTPMEVVYDPSHPDADDNGYVTYPNVSIIAEMTDLIDASRSYEANITAFNATKNMITKAFSIGR